MFGRPSTQNEKTMKLSNIPDNPFEHMSKPTIYDNPYINSKISGKKNKYQELHNNFAHIKKSVRVMPKPLQTKTADVSSSSRKLKKQQLTKADDVSNITCTQGYNFRISDALRLTNRCLKNCHAMYL